MFHGFFRVCKLIAPVSLSVIAAPLHGDLPDRRSHLVWRKKSIIVKTHVVRLPGPS
jgi:hypothetical protein